MLLYVLWVRSCLSGTGWVERGQGGDNLLIGLIGRGRAAPRDRTCSPFPAHPSGHAGPPIEEAQHLTATGGLKKGQAIFLRIHWTSEAIGASLCGDDGPLHGRVRPRSRDDRGLGQWERCATGVATKPWRSLWARSPVNPARRPPRLRQRLRRPAVRPGPQVRQRHRLAVVLPAARF